MTKRKRETAAEIAAAEEARLDAMSVEELLAELVETQGPGDALLVVRAEES